MMNCHWLRYGLWTNRRVLYISIWAVQGRNSANAGSVDDEINRDIYFVTGLITTNKGLALTIKSHTTLSTNGGGTHEHT